MMNPAHRIWRSAYSKSDPGTFLLFLNRKGFVDFIVFNPRACRRTARATAGANACAGFIKQLVAVFNSASMAFLITSSGIELHKQIKCFCFFPHS
jgi:hypothetical protein